MDLIDVIIETPRGSRNKYIYNEDKKMHSLKKVLPMGMFFPFDFGFIPNTLAEDGDPVDIVVLMEEPVYPGIMVSCRIIGALEVSQTKDNRTVRNDRIFGIFQESLTYRNIFELGELDNKIVSQVEQFFISYTKQEGKEIEILRRANAKEALKLIEAAKK